MLKSVGQRKIGIVTCLSLAMVWSLLLISCDKEIRQYQKTVEGVTVTMSTGKGRFVKGKNDVKIVVTDASGKAIANARVDVRYFTTAAQRKPSLEVLGPAMPKDDAYLFEADFPSSGEWNSEIMIRSPEFKTPLIMAAFKIEVEE